VSLLASSLLLLGFLRSSRCSHVSVFLFLSALSGCRISHPLVTDGLLRLLFSGNGDPSLEIVVYGQPWFTFDLGTDLGALYDASAGTASVCLC